jgi:hypothetical protein
MKRIENVWSYTGGANEQANEISVGRPHTPEAVGTMISVFVELNTAVQQESVRRGWRYSEGRRARATALAASSGKDTAEIKLWLSN